MGKVICITNQKGGVGKTTTALQLGKGLQLIDDSRVLFVDMDPQCNLSYVLGAEDTSQSIMEVLTGKAKAADAVQIIGENSVIASSQNISLLDKYLQGERTEYALRDALKPIRSQYDYIVIDSPPTLGMITVNVLTASDSVIIPAQSDILSLQGVGQLYQTIETVRTYCNPGLEIGGLLLTRHNDRLVHSRQMKEMLQETAKMIGTKVFDTTIRDSVLIREAMTCRQSIFEYAPRSRQAEDYWQFVGEYLGREIDI